MQCVIEQYKEAGADYTFSTTKALHPVLTEVIFENWKTSKEIAEQVCFLFCFGFLFVSKARKIT